MTAFDNDKVRYAREVFLKASEIGGLSAAAFLAASNLWQGKGYGLAPWLLLVSALAAVFTHFSIAWAYYRAGLREIAAHESAQVALVKPIIRSAWIAGVVQFATLAAASVIVII